MYWTCQHCQSENENKYDYCANCEEQGCTLNNHNCKEES